MRSRDGGRHLRPPKKRRGWHTIALLCTDSSHMKKLWKLELIWTNVKFRLICQDWHSATLASGASKTSNIAIFQDNIVCDNYVKLHTMVQLIKLTLLISLLTKTFYVVFLFEVRLYMIIMFTRSWIYILPPKNFWSVFLNILVFVCWNLRFLVSQKQ